MIKTKKFSEIEKVMKAAAAIYSVQNGTSLIESDMRIILKEMKEHIKHFNGKAYGFGASVGIREYGTESSISGRMFRLHLLDKAYIKLYNITLDPHTKEYTLECVTEEEVFM